MRSPTPLLAFLLPLLGLQSSPPVEPARHATCVRYYSLEGDVSPDLVRRAVAGLSTLDAEARIVVGPAGVSSRPKSKFLALELPVGTTGKDVRSALKKASRKTLELAWSAFQGEDRQLPAILGYSGLECVVGMDNDMRWFDLEGGLARFFYLPGKMDEKDLRKRFTTLYKPFDAEELGELVRAKLEWKLAGPLDAASARSAERALAKLPGIREPEIDLQTERLTAEVAYDGLLGSAPAVSRSTPGERLAAGAFLSDDVLAALESAGIAIDPSSGVEGK